MARRPGVDSSTPSGYPNLRMAGHEMSECLKAVMTFSKGFKGAPSARQARAEPAQRDRELKTRSAGEECVRKCERDHLVLSGE